MRRRPSRMGVRACGQMGTVRSRVCGPGLPASPSRTLPLFLCAVLLVGCGGPPEQPQTDAPLQVELAVSTNVIHIGDPIDIDLTVTHPVDGELESPEPGNSETVTIRSSDIQRRELDASRMRTTYQYTITSFRIGAHDIFTNDVVFSRSDGEVLRAAIPASVIEVQSVLEDAETPLQGIRDLFQWPRKTPAWVLALAAVGFIALLAAVFIRRYLARPRTILQYPPGPPPHEMALQALRNLLSRGWIEEGAAEPFYVELSNIVRRYLEQRFNLHAPEQTTEEFIREAAGSQDLQRQHRELTAGFLEQSDLVKFARHKPWADDMRAAYASAERLVQETKKEQLAEATAN